MPVAAGRFCAGAACCAWSPSPSGDLPCRPPARPLARRARLVGRHRGAVLALRGCPEARVVPGREGTRPRAAARSDHENMVARPCAPAAPIPARPPAPHSCARARFAAALRWSTWCASAAWLRASTRPRQLPPARQELGTRVKQRGMDGERQIACSNCVRGADPTASSPCSDPSVLRSATGRRFCQCAEINRVT